MKEIIEQLLRERCKKKVRFTLLEVEQDLLERYHGYDRYMKKGGYGALYEAMKELQADEKIRPLKTSKCNNNNPPLELKWEWIKEKDKAQWKKERFFKVADLLDLSYYEKNPKMQSQQEWKHIEKIYGFLKNKDQREWVSIEERSLELFGDEKYITDNEKKEESKILKRLNLTLEDIKAIRYGEFFVHWTVKEKDIETILIVENHATFFAYKRLIEENSPFLDPMPQMIIFGEGKKIISSFSFLKEFVAAKPKEILYFGDIDPEGWQIYTSLAERYPDYHIQLHFPSYIELLRHKPLQCKQRVHIRVLEQILVLFKEMGYPMEAKKIEELWKKNERLPQEYITYEYVKKWRV